MLKYCGVAVLWRCCIIPQDARNRTRVIDVLNECNTASCRERTSNWDVYFLILQCTYPIQEKNPTSLPPPATPHSPLVTPEGISPLTCITCFTFLDIKMLHVLSVKSNKEKICLTCLENEAMKTSCDKQF